MARKSIGIGLIGSGFIARCHVFGYRQMPVAFPKRRRCAAPRTRERRTTNSHRGPPKSSASRERPPIGGLVADPKVDIVDICVPSHLHREIALAAIASGKMVYCEKPVGFRAMRRTPSQRLRARRRSKASSASPTCAIRSMRLARNDRRGRASARSPVSPGCTTRIILSDPDPPFPGVVIHRSPARRAPSADLGCHIISIARMLVGEIAEVNCHRRTVFARTQAWRWKSRAVENEDEAHSLVRFATGATGTLSASRIATGARMRIGFDLVGAKGALRFDGERLGELQLFTRDANPAREGFRTIYAGPKHLPDGVLSAGPCPWHFVQRPQDHRNSRSHADGAWRSRSWAGPRRGRPHRPHRRRHASVFGRAPLGEAREPLGFHIGVGDTILP